MYKHNVIVLLTLGVLGFIPPALAQDANTYHIKGKQLLSYCADTIKMLKGEHYNVSKSSWCIGFIQGSVTAHRFYTVFYTIKKHKESNMSNDEMMAEIAKNSAYCIPSNVTLGQMVRDVVQFLEKNPKYQNEQASLSVARALNKAYPCQAQSKGFNDQ